MTDAETIKLFLDDVQRCYDASILNLAEIPKLIALCRELLRLAEITSIVGLATANSFDPVLETLTRAAQIVMGGNGN